MKRNYFTIYYSLILFLLLLVNAKSFGQYSISPSSASFVYSGGSQSVSVSVSNSTSWSVSPGQSWLSVSPSGGFNSGSFTITCANNTNTSSRSGTVTVTFQGTTRTVSVTQAGAPPPTYAITSSAGTGGSITPNGTTTVNDGSSQSFIISANPGYNIADVSVDGASQGPISSYLFSNVKISHTISATFSLQTFTISTNSSPSNGGSTNGGGSISYNNYAYLYASPNSSYNFINWTENGSAVSSSQSYVFIVTINRSLTANFTIKQYNINASPGSNGSISPPGTTTVNDGSSQSYIITANPGYNIADVSVDGTSQGPISSYTFSNVKASHTLTANFSPKPYTIATQANPSGGGTVGGGGTVNYGSSATVTASAYTNYRFVDWTENGTEVSTSASYTFTCSGNRNLTANFALYSCTITAVSSAPSCGTTSGGGIYILPNLVVLTATPFNGYQFSNWSEGNNTVSTSATYAFRSYGDRTLVANFYPIAYVITTSSNPSTDCGTTSIAGVPYIGNSMTAYAIAKNGYLFVDWTENGTEVSTNPNYTFPCAGNRNLTANFSPKPYTIATQANPSGGGTVGGGGTVNYGSSATVTASAYTNYRFVDWTENGTEVSTSASYTFTCSGNRNLTANFALYSCTITAVSSAPSCGTTSGGGIYILPNLVVLTATPFNGYQFSNWSEGNNTVSTSATYAFRSYGDRTLVANFYPIAYVITTSSNPSTDCGTTSIAGVPYIGNSMTAYAIAKNGYLFVDWTENGTEVSTNPNYTFPCAGNRNLTANFALIQYTITTISSPANAGTITGGGSMDAGHVVVLTAHKKPGYQFSNWTDRDNNIVCPDSIYSFRASVDITLTANFYPIAYVITTTSNPSTDCGTTSVEGVPYIGNTITVHAIALAGCYDFFNWTENGIAVAGNSTSPNYSFTCTGNRNLTANFKPETFTITPISNPLGVGTFSGGGTYNYGSSVTIVANENANYIFVNWTEGSQVVSPYSIYTFTCNGARTLTANYSAKPYAIASVANPTEGGTISGGGTINYGSSLTLIATANQNYIFVDWTENGTEVSTNPNYTFSCAGNRNLTANFALIQYTITTISSPANAGTITGGGPESAGHVVVLNANANNGYKFQNWSDINNNIVCTDSTYAFRASVDITLTANFYPVALKITTISIPSNDWGTTSLEGVPYIGNSLTVHAIAKNGYYFTNWTEKGIVVSSSPDYTFTCNGDRNLSANFTVYHLWNSANNNIYYNAGKVGIGAQQPDEILTIDGKTHATEITVDENIGADFVFQDDYKLKSLEELESYVKMNKHLPGIPTAIDVDKNGIALKEIQVKLLQKVEELTLYMIELTKENNDLEGIINNLAKDKLKNR